jgi:hypothetical protein
LIGLGAGIGSDLYDAYQNRPGTGPGGAGAVDVSDTRANNEDDLSGFYANQPQANFDTNYPDWMRNVDRGAADTSDTNAWIDRELGGMPMPEVDPSLWDNVKQGGAGALDLYIGSQQGGVGGAGNMLSGGANVYDALGGANQWGDRIGSAGDILSGISEGGVSGYGQAAAGSLDLAHDLGYSVPGAGGITSAIPVIGGLYNAYEGIQQGDPAGYANALAGGYGAATAAGLTTAPAVAGTMAAGSGAAGALGAFGTVAPLAAAGFAIADIANHYLDSGKSGRLEQFVQQTGIIPHTINRGRTNVTIYELPGGNFVDAKDVDWLYQGSKDNHKSPENREAWVRDFQNLANPSFQSTHFSPVERNYIEQLRAGQGHARGGLSHVRKEGPMRKYAAGGLAMANRSSGLDNPQSYYRYGQQAAQPPQRPVMQQPGNPVMAMPQVSRAMGGGLNMGYNAGGAPGAARLVKGPGTGRSDDIPARLSDGEYVFDAETVALLGDGSTDEGARRLDALRKKLRMHKGKKLSKGEFSAKAHNPEGYLE